jgi:glycine reductase
MREVLARLADFALRLCEGGVIGTADEEGYLPRGIRLNRVVAESAAERAVRMLIARLAGLPFQTEVPLRSFEAIRPAPPLADLSTARLALLSTGGIVPLGNPDHLKHVNESRWRRYSIEGLSRLAAGDWEPIHGGFDASHARRDPNVVVPLDELRVLEQDGRIGSILNQFYSVVGVGASTATCRQMGEEIAADLLAEGVTGVILTST